VGVWPRLAGGKTRALVMSSLDGMELSRRWFWVKGSPLMAAVGCNSQRTQSGIWCRQHGARPWSACEVSAS
jgi:hypothetical protein